jgi:hypothetical protein
MKIIGVIIRDGTFEGHNYHNAYFQGTEPFAEGRGIGYQAKAVKVKIALLSELLGKMPTEKDLSPLVGKELTFFYNEFKTVTHIEGLK